MPRKCCVPACKGNYSNGPKVSVFTFPANKELRQKWLKAICRDDFVPTKQSVVSHIYFISFLMYLLIYYIFVIFILGM